MEDYSLFDLLANGVIVFKNRKIEFINRHILDILNVAFLDKADAIDIIVKTIGIDDEDGLYTFFNSHGYFKHNGKVIQIEQNRFEDMEICSFMLIESSLICEKEKSPVKSQKISIDKKVASHFKLNNIRKVGVLTFFKGLPLKSIGKILRINQNSIEIIVDTKHRISITERDDLLLIINSNKGGSAVHGHVYEADNEIFTIKDFSILKEGMHQREGVRIKPEDDMFIVLESDKFKIYDISEKGISIYISSLDEEELLKKKKTLNINYHENNYIANVEYLKTIYSDGNILKIVFKMFNSGDTALKIHNYIIKRQNEIIKEIHEYRNQYKKRSVDVHIK